MKKALVLLLLFIVACGGTSEETSVEDTTTTTVQDTTTTTVQDTTTTTVQDTTTTTVQDTTTTTIPPAPTSDTNYVELYNSKLGTELCSDAKEIDTTSEECLRQYKENLNYLITLQNEIGDFASDLIAYYETYPELINQEYEEYINFVENEYSQVFTAANNVENKYIERFGGIPVINAINIFNLDNLEIGCSCEGEVLFSENFKSGEIEYINEKGEILKFQITNNNNKFKKLIQNSGGLFKVKQILVKNYLDEIYSISYDSSFYVKSYLPRIIDVNIDNSNLNIGDVSYITIDYEPGYVYKHPRYINLLFYPEKNTLSSWVVRAQTIFRFNNSQLEPRYGGTLDKNSSIVNVSLRIVESSSNLIGLKCYENCDKGFEEQKISNFIAPHPIHKEVFLGELEMSFEGDNIGDYIDLRDGPGWNYEYFGPCEKVNITNSSTYFDVTLTFQD